MLLDVSRVSGVTPLAPVVRLCGGEECDKPVGVNGPFNELWLKGGCGGAI